MRTLKLILACVLVPVLASCLATQPGAPVLSFPVDGALDTAGDAAAGPRLPTPTPEAVVAGSTAEQAALLAKLKNWGPAPEIANETWFNSPPLRLADLRGKVVMVEFWTYGCINCQHVIPALQEWHAAYADDGLVIIGVHTPEFRYEADLANVADAIERLGVVWPVTIDNDKVTWRAYANRFWPAMYLVDKQGNLRHLKIGEGQYEHTRSVIEALLAEPA